MAVYKVPQDVEAEDKLVGPFSLKQFIFILLFLTAGWIAFILSRIFLPLGVIMLPFLIVFGTLGFVHRKDQPVEVYLAALIRFYLKPHRRRWDQDGYDQRVIITAPKIVEVQRARIITQDEVQNRLTQLARIVDTRGWAAKGLTTAPAAPIQAQTPTTTGQLSAVDENDIMDDQGAMTQKFDSLLEQQTQTSRENAIKRMQTMSMTPSASVTPVPQVQQTADTQATIQSSQPVGAPQEAAALQALANELATPAHFNPYPQAMHQRVIQPSGGQQIAPPQQTPPVNPVQEPMKPKVSPAIIQLANNNDLTVSAIARQAHALPTDEVVISLR
jgi:PrgI family protein